MLGSFVFVMSVWAPAILMAGLRLRSVVTGDHLGQYQFSEYLGLQVSTVTVVFVLVMGLGYFLSGENSMSPVFLLIGLSKAIEIVIELVYGLFQRHGVVHLIAYSRAARAIASMLGLLLGMLIGGGLTWGCLGFFSGSLLVALAIDIPKARSVLAQATTNGAPSDRLFPRFPFNRLLRLLRSTLPLGITAILVSLTVNIPKYFVKNELGDSSLGFFGAALFVVAGATLVINAICNSFLPQLSASYKTGRIDDFRRLTAKFVGANGTLGIAGVVVSLAVGPFLFHSVLGFQDVDVFPSFVLVMSAGALAFVAHALQFILVATERYSAQVLPVVLDLVVTTILCWILIPRFAITGAAIAVLVGSAVRMLGFLTRVAPILASGSTPTHLMPGDRN